MLPEGSKDGKCHDILGRRNHANQLCLKTSSGYQLWDINSHGGIPQEKGCDIFKSSRFQYFVPSIIYIIYIYTYNIYIYMIIDACLETALIISFCFWTKKSAPSAEVVHPKNFWIDPFPAGENLRIILVPVGRWRAPWDCELERLMGLIWFTLVRCCQDDRNIVKYPPWDVWGIHNFWLNSECTSKKGPYDALSIRFDSGPRFRSCSYPYIPPQIVLDMNPLERVSEFAISWIAVCFPLWDPLIAPWISMNGQ